MMPHGSKVIITSTEIRLVCDCSEDAAVTETVEVIPGVRSAPRIVCGKCGASYRIKPDATFGLFVLEKTPAPDRCPHCGGPEHDWITGARG